jgi:hypothetical protein
MIDVLFPRRVEPLVVAVLVLLAGCAGIVTDTTPESSGDGTATTTVEDTTTGPNLTRSEAKRLALDSEEEFIRSRLENATNLTGYGLVGITMTENATIVNRSDGGYYVFVVHPYSWSTERAHGDVASEATYFVTAEGATRIRGDQGIVPAPPPNASAPGLTSPRR